MTEAEFIDKWVGTPWLERGDSIHGIDCWALVVEFYRDVYGIELENNYLADIVSGYEQEVKKWNPDDNGLVFMCYEDGKPLHVGVVVGGGMFVLHARGCVKNGVHEGAVACDRMSVMKRRYKDMRFYNYKGM